MHWEELQQFSIDASVNISDAMKLPYWVIDDFYDKGAWKIKKRHDENHVQMLLNIQTHLENISKKI